ncbi:RecQ-mediated genome instability protein [Phanerochaete sordida]|uniref:RecQ-mediated genome instability protein 1 n=1 Tax=Phanerochaete sordida TaxID=48140 RepID=A0A9P3LAP1_9APHY|nr:RecQ-mediated genome instability protein [Phanerochaete sordida]
MPPPPQVIQWLKRNYPKPSIDPDWLEGCYSWIESDLQLNPATQMDDILHNIESQLLQSNLMDSMLRGTGLPPNVAELNNTTLAGPPVLVEIVTLTEVGASAFTLQNVRQARLERADLAGLAGGEDDAEDDDAGPVPRYPRGMLRLQLSDGATTLEAIEYRRIPELELGETRLGYKMLLKDVFIRRGIAWLEPKNIIHKGYQTEERQQMQDHDFVNGLNIRMRKPEIAPAPVAPAANPPRVAQPASAPAPAPAAPAPANPSSSRARPPPSGARSPLQQIDEPAAPVAGPSHSHLDDEDQPRRRKVPARPASPPAATASRPTVSRFFTSASASPAKDKASALAGELQLSPHRQPPLFLPESDDERAAAAAQPGPSRAPQAKAKSSADGDWQMTLAGGDDSSDYDVDLDLGLEEMVAAVERAEQEHGARASSTTVSSGALPSSGSRAAPVTRIPQERSIIEIDDDEDEKENVPAPTRHVRRRTATQRASQVVINEDDIIELSD